MQWGVIWTTNSGDTGRESISFKTPDNAANYADVLREAYGAMYGRRYGIVAVKSTLTTTNDKG